MKKVSWADIQDEEEAKAKEEQQKKYVPPHKKDSPILEAIKKKTKLPHTTNTKKL